MTAYYELNTRAKINCIDQFVNVICPYEEFDDFKIEVIPIWIQMFIDTAKGQFWFDENGDWYDEGRKVRK